MLEAVRGGKSWPACDREGQTTITPPGLRRTKRKGAFIHTLTSQRVLRTSRMSDCVSGLGHSVGQDAPHPSPPRVARPAWSPPLTGEPKTITWERWQGVGVEDRKETRPGTAGAAGHVVSRGLPVGIAELCFLSLRFTSDRNGSCAWGMSSPRAEIRPVWMEVPVEHLLAGVFSSKQPFEEEAPALL